MMATDQGTGRHPRTVGPRHRGKPGKLYQRAIEAIEPGALAAAARAEGLDDEVAVLRVLLRRHLTEHPENVELMFKGMHLLVRMVTAQHGLSGEDAAQLEERLKMLARHFAAAAFGEEAADG
jgi:hypothetical protein